MATANRRGTPSSGRRSVPARRLRRRRPRRTPVLAAGLLPAPVVAAAYLGSVVLVTGVNHADGLADLGDAAVVHGDPETRRDVMRDTTIGVGAVLALGTALLALALAALAVARLPPLVAVSLVLAAEVEGGGDGDGGLHRPPEALRGSARRYRRERPAPPRRRTRRLTPGRHYRCSGSHSRSLTGPLLALGLSNWADQRLGGVSGDAFGTVNELTRAVALHVGVAVWSLFGGVWSIPLVDWGVLAWTLS
ncbi:adenosylcobinamide-GDP ribazoletransferase [Halogeometricum sp. wsp3]|nr:adenosylcobinamide-GDP ribazoletransferase [Halogeometricum sp. wsp3]